MENAKPNIFRNKKGINDISILTGIVFIFFFTAIMIPFVNSEFGTTASTLNVDGIADDVKEGAEGTISENSFSVFSVIFTVFKLAFFDFGDTLGLPFWLDAVYTVLGMMFIITLARNIWIGGGG